MNPYFVVFRTILSGVYEGAITCTCFSDEEDFNSWYDDKMQQWYEIVEQGVSQERAAELCSSDEARQITIDIQLRKLQIMTEELISGNKTGPRIIGPNFEIYSDDKQI